MGGKEWSALIGRWVPGKGHLSCSVARAVACRSDAELRVVGRRGSRADQSSSVAKRL